jgi:hypothetical protein
VALATYRVVAAWEDRGRSKRKQVTSSLLSEEQAVRATAQPRVRPKTKERILQCALHRVIDRG